MNFITLISNSLRSERTGLTQASIVIRSLSWFFFSGLVFTIPFRLRYRLVERPFPPIYPDYTDVLIYISDVFLLGTLATWALGVVFEQRRIEIRPYFLSIPIFTLAGLSLLNVLFSMDGPLSAYHAVRLLLLTGLYLFVLNEFRHLNQLVLPLMLQVLIQAGVGVAQVLRQSSLGFSAWGELELDPAWSGVSIVWAQGIRSLRAYGLTDHPNILGGCLAFALIVIATWFFSSNRRWSGPAIGVFALGNLGLVYTYSRSAWLAFAAALWFLLGIFLITRQFARAQRWLNLVGAASIVILPFLWQNAALIGVRLNWQGSFQEVPYENQAIGERQLLAESAMRIFSKHPWMGVGLGTLPLALRQEYPEYRVAYQPAHTVLLDVAAETGIFGALAVAVASFAPGLALWINRSRLDFSPVLVGLTGLWMAVTIIGFFDYYTWLLPSGRLWQWLVWGLWGMAYQSSLQEV